MQIHTHLVSGLKALRFTLFFLSLSIGTSSAAEVPHYDDKQHLGVASCASGVCHGSVRTRNATAVAQNEYVIWSRRDRHRVAYKTLLTDESKLIAKKMGLANAHKAGICLDCHADNVPVSKRGPRFQIDDGVSCESCHGGAEFYISSHVDPETPRGENLDAGLYPTDQPRARAKLCLSCHLGNSQKMASHDIMGAGHPRIAFELDAFTALQPAHFTMDEDYRAEKWSGSAVQLWSLGQIESARQTLKLIDSRLATGGLFPELALFDCHACHHSMSDQRWQDAAKTGLPAGSVRLNDANLVMLAVIAVSLDSDLGRTLKQDLKRLHQSVDKGQSGAAIKALQETVNVIDKAFSAANTRSLTPKLLTSIVKAAKAGKMNDYVSAEQAVMAVDMMLGLTGQRKKQLAWLDKLYATLQDEDKFNPASFVAAMKRY